MLEFDASTVTRIIATITLDFDPTGSTVELKVDGTWYDAIWLDTPVDCVGEWRQDAQTVEYFAGPEAETVMFNTVQFSNAPRHRTQTRVTLGDDSIVRDASTIAIV